MAANKRRTTYDAPVLPLEYPWTEGEEIHACHECLPWRVEFFFRHGEPAVREWHAVGCPVLKNVDEDAGRGPQV